MSYEQSRVGNNAALASLICLIATWFGVDIPNGVALAVIGVVVGVSVYLSPGWADHYGLKAYPAGLSAAVVIVLGWLLPFLADLTGIEQLNNFTQSDLVALAGLIPFAIGLLTPSAEEDIDPELIDDLDDLGRERVGEEDPGS